jgi:trehalose 6-phosphate phosphatase
VTVPADDSATTTADRLPNALDAPEVARRLDGRRPAVFLDYDGVLTPIVPRPEDAIMTGEMRDVLRSLAARCPVCIVSGRDRAVVAELSGVDDLVIAGSHGFDIWDPQRGAIEHEASRGWEDLVAEVTERVRTAAAEIEGTQVEPKHASVALHDRHVAPEERPRVAALVDEVLAEHPGELRVTPGKFVHEIQPKIDWNKGKAVEHLIGVLDLDRPGPDGRPFVPIYLGDDITDEDAFRALAERETPGLGVLVIDPSDAAGRETAATAVLATVDEVARFLDGLAR